MQTIKIILISMFVVYGINLSAIGFHHHDPTIAIPNMLLGLGISATSLAFLVNMFLKVDKK